jgi:hypothetical protein
MRLPLCAATIFHWTDTAASVNVGLSSKSVLGEGAQLV